MFGKELCMKETKEEKKAREAEAKARKEAERAAKEQAKLEAKEAKEGAEREAKEGKMVPAGPETARAELYQGSVSLMIATPIDLIRLRELEESLGQVEDLQLDLVGGSISDGTEIIVSMKKPLPLLEILNGMAPVEHTTKKDKKIQIVLKAA
jgi:hypothetical protein